ncbi:hypothetical protein VSS74_22760 [Conexibacter stalactiti]|uniref:SMP-30/Gluconolactonase/LRE-like region domain-containing protein n=1 Tax=Conexibacter stalactiti TaxID=1940611 RepID=A0ABU4HV49_9ACTN|nr:hypothetical protein [Conexibacter stalactiti]MDW5597186.1 hypothetical protein [Conexibacter stalactiti]MEC5037828.1 hypothetical protein [Conexibacter stalactiti]
MRSFLPLAVVAATAAITASPAAAAPTVSGEFPVTGRPGQLVLGPDGNTWVVLLDGPDDLARITPGGSVTFYRDARLDGAVGITAGADGRLWMTQPGRVVSFSTADPVGSATSFPALAIGGPERIISDDTGVLWTASGENVVSITTAGVVRSFRVAGMAARGIAFGGDRRLWIVDFGNGRIVATSRDGGTPEFFPVGGNPQEVAAGPGTQVAYTNQGATPHEIGRIDAPTVSRLVVDRTDPFGITRGLDDAYWIANFTGHDLTRLATDGTITRLGGFTPLSGPRWIATGAGGTLWVSLQAINRVALVTGLEAPIVVPPRVEPPIVVPPRVEPPRAADTTRPVLRKLGVSGRPRAGARAVSVGYTLSEPATIAARLSRKTRGKLHQGRCVEPNRRLRRARDCFRWVAKTAVTVKRAPAGVGSIVLQPRRGRLTAGTYRVVLSVTDAAGNRAADRTVTITLKAARRR